MLRASGIVSGGLNAARGSLAALETYDVVGLPAVEADRCMLEGLQCFVGVYAQGCIALTGNLIILLNLFCCHTGYYFFG